MISYYFHPTQVILLDDDDIFLALLADSLPKINFTYKLLNNPLDALNYISTTRNIYDSSINKYIKRVDAISFGSTLLQVNFSETYQEIFNAERFNTLSIVVADYNMPRMNGIELLRKIKNQNVKKVLLTGAADESVAVDAFNEGIIDRYIKKHSFSLQEVLINQLNILGTELFLKKTNYFLDPFGEIKNYPTAIFSSEFNDFFSKIIQENKIVEYYLFEKVGSFVMLDKNGKIYSLYTQNEDQAESFCLEIESLDDFIVSPELKQKIKARKKIFCYNISHNQVLPPSEQWLEYYQDCEQIGTEDRFYCAFINGFHNMSHINELLTYEYYKNNVAANYQI